MLRRASLLLLLLAGCGGYPQAKLDEARGLLTQALDAWKEGKPAAALKSLPRPIDFEDPLWKSGVVLVSYEVTRTHYDDKYKIPRCTVRLVLKDARGRETTEEVAFDVQLEPNVVISSNPLA